jgi:signal transduction histidine kinase
MTEPTTRPKTEPTTERQPVDPTVRRGSTHAAQSAHRLRGFRSWWAAAAEWRNWRLPVKVAAVLAVPAIAAIALGAVQIRDDVSRANQYGDTQQLISLRNSLIPLADDLQTERWQSAQKLGTTITVSQSDFQKLTARVDKDASTAADLGRQLLDPASTAGVHFQGLVGQLGGLASLHKQAFSGSGDAVTVITAYGQVINAVLDLEQALTPQFGDPALTSAALSLGSLEVAQEQIRLQEAIVTVAIARGSLLNSELSAVQAADVLLSDRLNNLQVNATPAQLEQFQTASITNDLNNREQLAQQVLSNGLTLMVVGSTGQGTSSLGVAPGSWISASDASAGQLSAVTGQVARGLTTTSADLRNAAGRAAIVESVILFAILLLAVGVGVIIGRNLLRSLGILRRTALDVAEHQLPEVVASIDAGDLTDLSIEPVPVHTHEELGQLARAFDAVHGQAVRSAVGQATLRSNLRNIFVNLSRRSQGLVERQLRLMERLERNEENPEQLANLFKLDHLATRMRRNNENLMVLSGDDPARRSSGPVPLADVVRAAVSEIEHYQRVVVRSTPSMDVLGYVAGDLTRLIAELLDNATSFSPPQSQVFVGGRSFADGSVRLEIRDDGIGIAEAELADANGKLDAGASPDVPVSRQMGLYVVGRLARRHSIRVVLETPKDGGLIAVVQVPAELVKQSTGPARSPSAEPAEGPFSGSFVGTVPTNGHNGAVNGHTRSVPTVSDAAPEWTGFSGPLIGDLTTTLTPTDFTWFVPEAPAEPSEPAQDEPPAVIQNAMVEPSRVDEPVSYAYTSVGLPRRVPRAHAVPSLVERPATQPAAAPPPVARPAAPAGSADAPRRNPTRARGFLNDYQAGVRQGVQGLSTAPPDTATENGNGEDR